MTFDRYLEELSVAFRRSPMSSAQLAQRCGVSEGHMSKVLRGVSMPSQRLFDTMAHELDLEGEEFSASYLAARGQPVGARHDPDLKPASLLVNQVEILEYDETFHLDTPIVYNEEIRFVRANRPGVTQMRLSVFAPEKDGELPQLDIIAREGCRIVKDEAFSWGGYATLAEFAEPVPTSPPHYHRFRIERRVVHGEIFPANVLTPSLPMGLIRSRIQFDPGNLPKVVQLIRGENQAALRDIVSGRPELVPDPYGLVELPEVRQPKEGLSYGVTWRL